MKTSYFGNPAIRDNPNAVSISRWSPRWWGSRPRYIALAPSADLLRRSKEGLSWPDYVTEYKQTVLDQLDPVKVYADLSDKIILCWESSNEECHRRLVAEWLEHALNVEIPEI
ncbi:MAG: DUF488 family protein [Syntrophaceae bacterium]|nr:DUF488 family protein [Syntrophaceae bacterium]